MDSSVTAKASEAELANSIRALAMDAVEAAKSGHPGMPMGMAEIAVALWKRHLRHNPANPDWANRDRFVLSNGHGSMLLYSLLHLTGYALPIEELKRFRQLGSKTPGHPERGCAPGVETTTGPLGQGISNAVGMALAERLLAAEFNRPESGPGLNIVDHYTYCFLGDGCMMEGISHEACALAGTLGLGKLIAIYDDNGISIDSDKGQIKQWYTDDVRRRFESYGWQVIPNVDGHDVDAVDKAIRKAKRDTTRPTLICAKTVIAKGAPKKANTGAAHGAPLGAEEIAATRAAIGWQHPAFQIPQPVYDGWDAREAGKRAERRWQKVFKAYRAAFPQEAAEFQRRMKGELPADFDAKVGALLTECAGKAEAIATRRASQLVLEALKPALPELVGGSADLTGSNLTMAKVSRAIGREGGGNYVFYGVREFGMSGVMNGIALHGGFVPYGGTFLGAAGALRFLARLHRLGRGRAHAPADRACGQPAPHPQYGCLAAGRSGGDRDRLGFGFAPPQWAERAAAHPAERAIPQERRFRPGRARRLCPRRRARCPRGHHCHRLRSRHRAGSAEAIGRRRAPGPGGFDALDERF
jgi:transketolase